MRQTILSLVLLTVAMFPTWSYGIEASFHVEAPDAPCAAWGIEKLKAAFAEAGVDIVAEGGTAIRIAADPASITAESSRKPEGFQLTVKPPVSRSIIRADGVYIAGYDAPGLMYGCLELARRVREAKGLPDQADVAEAPAMTLRGTCILLMKLGLYDYPVTPAEFPFFYDKTLWAEYLDFLAENRFNYIAFWNGHPFDYFVKLDKYPEAQDGLEAGLLERNHEMLMWLAREAEKRNIWLMFEFYNIHVSVYFAKAHNLPEHGISEPTPLLRDYTGYCIERFVSEFPSVGLYICPGESLKLEHTPDWINDVIFAAVKRSGKTPPIMVRSWGIDLKHMKEVVGNYPRLYTERKFNVEMIADTEIDPDNADWAKLSGNHVVNIHCMGNLEPFRWSPPSYIQKCVQSSVNAGATGIHLYPRKAWRWPYGCDKTDKPELQWNRDWMWFEAWGRYAWNANRDAKTEKAYWVDRLAKRFGANAAPHVLNAYEAGADVLPGIQRLVWLGNDNHTIVGAGITLEQLQTAKGIPFLDLRDTSRISEYITVCRRLTNRDALKSGAKPSPGNPVEFLARKTMEAQRAVWEAAAAFIGADESDRELQSLVSDVQAIQYVAKFYHHKLQAAVSKALADADVNVSKNAASCVTHLASSLNDFRNLASLTKSTYESMSDVPAWNPSKSLPCPYHWSDILPLFEKEFKDTTDALKAKIDKAADLELLAAAADLDGRNFSESTTFPSDVTSNLVLPLVARYQRNLPHPEEFAERKQSLRSKLLKAYGFDPMPERTPLNARTVGRIEYPQYVLEKIVYEAWPGIPVSAHLYLPKDASAPHSLSNHDKLLPCVLYTCGHWYHGKTEPGPRSFCVGMAHKGNAVLIYDPMGQGERFAEGEHGHRFPILAGLSQEGFMVWESMRAIDYIETRPEIDPKRIGMTGASGGGLNTIFTAAIEDRLAASAPVCYPVTYTDFLCAMAGRNWNGGLDLCNQVPGVITFARTSDLMACIAPKPVLQISAEEDVDFPIAGARQTAHEVSEIYGDLKASDAFKYVEAEAPHGYDKTMREAAYGFFLKALANQGDGSPSPEPPMELETWDDPKLRCFADGGNRLAGPLLETLVKSRLPESPEFGALPEIGKLEEWQDSLRARIREICKVPSSSTATVHPFPASTTSDGIRISGFSLEASLITAVKEGVDPKTAFIILSKRNRLETFASKLVRDLIDRNALVAVAGLTGLGEDVPSDFELATNLWMLDRTLPGEWIAEIQGLVTHMRTAKPAIPVCLIGMEGMAETALLAAAVIDDVAGVAVDKPLGSYHDLISHKVRWDASEYLPGVLRHFDLPQLLAAIAPRKAVLLNPINGFREPYRAEDIEKLYAFAKSAYSMMNTSPNLTIGVDKPLDAESVFGVAALP